MLFSSLELETFKANTNSDNRSLKQWFFHTGFHRVSDFCGYYCIAYILSIDSRLQEPLKSFLSRFQSQNPNFANDNITVNYIVDFIRKFGVIE